MNNTNTEVTYVVTPTTKTDQDAVKILRDAYMKMDANSDILYNARQYLQDRARYEVYAFNYPSSCLQF